MQAYHIDRMILGAISQGQGSLIAVGTRLLSALRRFSVDYVRGLSLCLVSWRALWSKCTSTGTTPAVATCPTIASAARHQRHERWMSGVVVDPGTVGDC
jgi:hypothetical protein